MPQIPSHVLPSLKALREELKEINSWIKEVEESIDSQKTHLNQYKIIAERRAKEIQELESKYNIKPS